MADIGNKLVAVWGLQGNCTSCTWYHQCTSTLREGTRTGVRKTKQTQCCHLNSITNWEKTNPLFDNFFYEKFREKSKDYLKKPGWRTVQNSVGRLLHWYYLTVVLTVLAVVPTTLTLVLVALALVLTVLALELAVLELVLVVLALIKRAQYMMWDLTPCQCALWGSPVDCTAVLLVLCDARHHPLVNNIWYVASNNLLEWYIRYFGHVEVCSPSVAVFSLEVPPLVLR